LAFKQIEGDSENDIFGNPLRLNEDGSILAVGAQSFDGPEGIDSGLVRVYRFDGSDWQQLGQDIYGDGPDDHLPDGLRLNPNGTVLAVGAGKHDSPVAGDDSGFAKVYRFNGTAWAPLGQTIEAENIREASGRAVELSADGSVLAVSSIDHDGNNGADSGGVRVFLYDTSIEMWEQVGPYM